MTVTGEGVLIYPRQVVALEVPVVTGQVLSLGLEPGDKIEQGQVVATIAQPDLQEKLQQLQLQLQQLEAGISTISGPEISETEDTSLGVGQPSRQQVQQQVQQQIGQLEQQIQSQSQVVSPYPGKVLELAISPGQWVQRGMRLATIATHPTPNLSTTGDVPELLAISYFPVAEGRQIKPGMKIQVLPDTIAFQPLGSLAGEVIEVSPFPVTPEAALNTLGNPALLPPSISTIPQLEVKTLLLPHQDHSSGYTGAALSAPPLVLTPGTTITTRILVKKVAPIELVLPGLVLPRSVLPALGEAEDRDL
jgi:HlyD family secretion protein